MGYQKEIYRKAQQELSRRRQRAYSEAENMRNRIYSELPEIVQLENRLRQTGVAAARAVFSGADTQTELEKLRNENLAIQKEMRIKLASRNYIPADLEEKYTCPSCKDKGYIDGQMCGCMRKLLRDTAFSELNSKSPLSLENSRFETFSLEWYSDSEDQNGKIPRRRMENNLNFCRRYAETFSTSSRSILMEGGTGLGKTHLSLAIAGRIIERGFGVIYGTAPDIVSALKAENSYFNTDHSVLEQYESCDMLILDDLGTEFPTNQTKATIYNLLNTRLTRNKPTIINTNLTLIELKNNYTDRLISRMIGDNIRLTFIGDDVRIAKKKRRIQNGEETLSAFSH